MVKYILIVLFSLATSWAAEDKPEPHEALKAFEAYQRHVRNPAVAQRDLSKLEKSLGMRSVIIHGEDGKHAPVLAFVAFSRRHFKEFHKPYATIRRQIAELVASANFEAHLYQLNDLHPDQGRQSIWQFSNNGVTMRIEVVPNNAITITFFTNEDFRSGLHATRHALIPPRFQ